MIYELYDDMNCMIQEDYCISEAACVESVCKYTLTLVAQSKIVRPNVQRGCPSREECFARFPHEENEL